MLIIRPNVRLNGALAQVLCGVAPHAGSIAVEVTSGLREPADQLKLIGWFALQNEVKFPEFGVHDLYDKKDIDGQELYTWQRTWSRLLHIGIIINPPFAAVCVEDSFRPDGTNRNGMLIPGSPHSRGTAFDISGRGGIDQVCGVLADSMAKGAAIKNWQVERKNNAVHVNIRLDPEEAVELAVHGK